MSKMLLGERKLLAVLGVELRDSSLQGRCFITPVMLPALFALVIFEIGSHFMPGPAWTVIFLFVLPCIARMMSKHHHAQLLVQMASHNFFA
jgi:hypothetical protein